MKQKSWNGISIWPLPSAHAKFQLSSSISGGERIMEEQSFIQAKNKKTSHIFSTNWPMRLIFRYIIQLWIVHRLTQKKNDFHHCSSLANPSLNLGITGVDQRSQTRSEHRKREREQVEQVSFYRILNVNEFLIRRAWTWTRSYLKKWTWTRSDMM